MLENADVPLIKNYEDFKKLNNTLKSSEVSLSIFQIDRVSSKDSYIIITDLDSGVQKHLELDDFVYYFVVNRTTVIKNGISKLSKYNFTKLYLRTHPAVFDADVKTYINGLITMGYKEFKLLDFQLSLVGNEVIITSCDDMIKANKVIIPNCVTKIASCAFKENQNIEEVIFGDASNLTEIGNAAFSDSSITAINIPSKVKEIKGEAFLNCYSLESVTFASNSNLEIIGQRAFSHCKFKSLSIPNSVRMIGWGAFEVCSLLEEINIPQRVTKIEEDTFKQCHRLKTVVRLGKSTIKIIESDAFSFCYALKSFKLDGVNSIGYQAFSLSGLEVVDVPSSVKSLSPYAFRGCFNLKSAKLPENILELPEGVFSDCEKLESIELPSNLKVIGPYAFMNTGFKTIKNLPKWLKVIGHSSFMKCKKLDSVELPNSVEKISMYAFADCMNLKEINIPKNLKEFTITALHQSYCLQKVYVCGDSITHNPELKNLKNVLKRVEFVLR